MPNEEYFAVVNDNPAFAAEAVTICRDGSDDHLHRDRETALDARDRLRDEYDNPDINVYRMTLHEGSLEREERGEQ